MNDKVRLFLRQLLVKFLEDNTILVMILQIFDVRVSQMDDFIHTTPFVDNVIKIITLVFYVVKLFYCCSNQVSETCPETEADVLRAIIKVSPKPIEIFRFVISIVCEESEATSNS